MREKLAIHVQDVSKTYSLYGSQRDQFVDVLRLSRFGLRPRSAPTKFNALTNINLDIQRGQRLGIIGRNGAGKTTLLKLLCGNFKPTSGSIEVNGTVQALMSIGLGFHPEYTGRENVRASLHYNGLSRDEFASATDDIIEFCELGEFFDQPFKTYSLGMQARLMFAAATAISPDILIVDEVLGAGDAYFVAKSKVRMQSLVQSGCTMLLVSHSMQQVLEFCDSAIWIDKGLLRKTGDAFSVVKAYEESIHGSSQSIQLSESPSTPRVISFDPSDNNDPEKSTLPTITPSPPQTDLFLAQEPLSSVQQAHCEFSPIARLPLGFHFIARGGLSQWDSTKPGVLRISGFSMQVPNSEKNVFQILDNVRFVIETESLQTSDLNCRYGISISDPEGRVLTSLRSPRDTFSTNLGDIRRINMNLQPLQLGPGQYFVGVAVWEYSHLEGLNSTNRFDLLSRSFEFSVEAPASLQHLQERFFHSSDWTFHTTRGNA